MKIKSVKTIPDPADGLPVRARIIRAVIRLINSYGFELLSVGQVAVASKLKRCEILAEFPTTEDLKVAGLKFSLEKLFLFFRAESGNDDHLPIELATSWQLISEFIYFHINEALLIDRYLDHPSCAALNFGRELLNGIPAYFRGSDCLALNSSAKAILLFRKMIHAAVRKAVQNGDSKPTNLWVACSDTLFNQQIKTEVARLQKLPFY